ncbi:MAG: hypothetical protein BGO14_10055 [Chlamydiales bacterium 38-26]|nr:motility associated factor glycosyltransferase family protein [Chlamydiales bacterium]OJV11308.1 MAG: hypothetical protein BGO14_10055 [Chlamydiales bacterium 38-26]
MDEQQFKRNLSRWATLNNKEIVKKLESLECKHVVLGKNEDGQLNLKKNTDPFPEYYHSTLSPLREAQQWFLSLELKDTLVLYVYGIGLGYYYEVLKSWLREDLRRYVVFLENDLEVIKNFLSLDRTSEFLYDRQAKLFHFDWDTCYFTYAYITSMFALAPFKISALKYYEKTDPQHVTELQARVAFFHDMRLGTSAEFLAVSATGFISNYFKNLLELPTAKLQLKMQDHFKGVPAIICGAGPSLGKNIHLLKELQDKALIMAGGTAMNVLNGAGINPHFGLGIDPNPAHYNRLISNTAFEVPFFYRQRMYNKALKTVHGEHIYVTGAGGYRLPTWFEKNFEIPAVEPLEEGHNVVNFNLSIARELGCNPIIIVGVDLAYSNNSSYAPGLVRHAIHDPKDAFITKYSHEELLVKNDIYGNPVHTLWKWVNESLWFTHFATKYPEITLLNCTEGGIGFSQVPNMDLLEASEKYLKKSFDFLGRIHGEIQMSPVPSILNEEKVLDSIERLARSLLACETFCANLVTEFGKVHVKLEADEEVSENLKTAAIEENLTKLEEEDAFKYLLVDYKERYLEIFFPRLINLECDTAIYSKKEIEVKKAIFEISLYAFLARISRQNINILGEIFSHVLSNAKKPVAKPLKKTLEVKEKLLKEREEGIKNALYAFKDGTLTLIDPELDLNISMHVTCQPEEILYPNGMKKWVAFTSQDKFYGPAQFYDDKGQILSECWYVDGRMEGRACLYYPSGNLYAIKRFKKGLLEGKQEYYYPDGMPKSLFYYREGLIHGDVTLFYPSGRIKRELHYEKGKKEGVERMWNDDAMIMLEARYKDNNPIGIAREWYSNGNLAKEIRYSEDSEDFEVKLWEENGVPVRSETTRGHDYFDLVTNHSKTLNTSLQNIYKALINIAPTIPDQTVSVHTSVEEDLLALKKDMDKLNKYSQEMLKIGGFEGKSPKEALWKTPETEKIIRTQLDSISKNLSKVTEETQASLADLFEKLNQYMQKSQDSDNHNPSEHS